MMKTCPPPPPPEWVRTSDPVIRSVTAGLLRPHILSSCSSERHNIMYFGKMVTKSEVTLMVGEEGT